MSSFDKLVLLVAAILAIPILITPAGWLFGVILVVGWIATAYGARYLLDLERYRRQGERGWTNQIRSQGGDLKEGRK